MNWFELTTAVFVGTFASVLLSSTWNYFVHKHNSKKRKEQLDDLWARVNDLVDDSMLDDEIAAEAEPPVAEPKKTIRKSVKKNGA